MGLETGDGSLKVNHFEENQNVVKIKWEGFFFSFNYNVSVDRGKKKKKSSLCAVEGFLFFFASHLTKL